MEPAPELRLVVFPAMFILRRLSLGGKPSSMSKSSSDSPSSSKIWLSTGALFLEVRRLVMEGGLWRRITWVGRGDGSCSSSSSSSSSTLRRTLLCFTQPLTIFYKFKYLNKIFFNNHQNVMFRFVYNFCHGLNNSLFK